MGFKIDWNSLMVGRKFTVLAFFYFVFQGNFQVQAPVGAYIWRGDLTEGFLRYEFGGFIHGGTYFRHFTILCIDPGLQLNWGIWHHSTVCRCGLAYCLGAPITHDPLIYLENVLKVKTSRPSNSQKLLTKNKGNRVPKCDVVENEICEIMGFVRIF